ncbi:hypothetical protein [Maritalea myrionectae]|uniref:hypothetical protein n=1 Tax=Maritalea myrionectae TaxID=454601 RepID=UPI00146C1081|nr:hypothetical protein [Maritalea myrionectae]
MDIWAVCSNIECRYARILDLRKMAHYVGAHHPLVPRRGELHFSERLRCPKCRHRGSFLWANFQRPSELVINNYSFVVKELDGNKHVSTLIFARDSGTARTAFEAMVKERPKARLSLQHGARVIEENY